MARLFISHSSANNDKAVEVRDWLAKNGWDDVFLDLDPERGIVAGQRWKDALQKAAYRCEVVLALVSKEWLASGWCKSEIDAARLMGKKVMAALVNVDKSAVPLDLIDEQFIDLTGDPQAYRRLKEGLKRSGLDPTTFPFDADRPPYPGFAYLEEKDAAVFFGRDAQIVRGLDEIRRLARTGVTRMFVILGASGSGKSSFLRAGLWPRLKRDDLAWLLLPIVRPERAAMSGKYGLAESLYETVSDPRFAEGMRQRGLPRSRLDIQDFIEKTGDGLAQVLAALRDIAQAGASGEKAAPLTILLAIDQGEELFNEEGREEARRFIDILTKTLAADPRTMAILVMRSDAFPLVQNEPALAALPKDTFTLDMMLEGSYRAVIEGPARLLDPPLFIDPQLVDALLEDISGQDALPLLAFTLRHLYDNTRVDNALTLAGYDKIGRVKGVIAQTVEQAYAEAVAKGEAPKDKEERLRLARSAFIPHLAQVNPAGQFVRRVSPRDKIPSEARPLVDRFAEQRLLIRDRRQDAEVIEVAHEALLRQPPFSDWLSEDREFLLWRDRLTQARTAFEADERGLLTGRELAIARSYTQARAEREFEPADLAFIGDSVTADDTRRAEEEEERLRREAAEKEEQGRRIRDAERIAEEQRRTATAQKSRTRIAIVGLAVALTVAVLALWQYVRAVQAQNAAQREASAARAALSAQIAAHSQLSRKTAPVRSVLLAIEALNITGRFNEPRVASAEEALRRSLSEAGGLAFGGYSNPIEGVELSLNGQWLVTTTKDGTDAELWNIRDPFPGTPITLAGGRSPMAFSASGRWLITTAREGQPARLWDLTSADPRNAGQNLSGAVGPVAFSGDDRWLVTGGVDGSVRLWDLRNLGPDSVPTVLPPEMKGTVVLAISPDSRWLATSSWMPDAHSGTTSIARLWDLTATDSKATSIELKGHTSSVSNFVFSRDSHLLATGSAEQDAHTGRHDNDVRVWDLTRSDPSIDPRVLHGHDGSITAMAMSPDGRWLVTGSKDNTARLWDLSAADPAAGQPILPGHEDQISDVIVSADGLRIVTVSRSSRNNPEVPKPNVRFWQISASDHKAMPKVFTDSKGIPVEVVSSSLSADGRWLLLGSTTVAYVFDLAQPTPADHVRALSGHEGAVVASAFAADGLSVVTGSEDGMARLWRLSSASTSADPLTVTSEDDEFFAVSPDSRWLLTVGDERAGQSSESVAVLHDLAAPDVAAAPIYVEGHNGPIFDAAISEDQRWLATSSSDKTAHLWRMGPAGPTSTPLTLGGNKSFVSTLAFSRDGRRLATGSFDGTVQLWDLTSSDPSAQSVRLNAGGTVFKVQIDSGSRWLVSSGDEQTPAMLWDLTASAPGSGRPLKDGGKAFISPDQQWLVTYGSDKRRVLREALVRDEQIDGSDTRTRRELQARREQIEQIPSVTTLWDFHAADPAATGKALAQAGEPIAFSPDGNWLISRGIAELPQLWALSGGGSNQGPLELHGHTEPVAAAAFDRSGRWLVTGSYDGTARIWDLSVSPITSKVLATHKSGVSTVVLSHDDRWIFTASGVKGDVHLVPLPGKEEPGAQPLSLPMDDIDVWGAAFTRDGRWLVTRSHDTHTLSLWTLELQELVKKACRTSGRNLTLAEWDQYFSGQPYRKVCDIPGSQSSRKGQQLPLSPSQGPADGTSAPTLTR